MALTQLNFAGLNKVEVAIMRLKEFEPTEGYQLAFSGGKDSVVIYHLAEVSQVKFHPFMNWTGIDPPELYQFVKEHYPDIEIRRPGKTMWQLIKENQMLPLRKVRFCCEELKERGTSGYLITGIRWAESTARKNRRMVEASFKYCNLVFVHPIIDWSNYDVWEYIRLHSLPYCKLYDEGFTRLGCILCPFTRRTEVELQMRRFPKHVLMWKHACDRLIETQTNPRFKTGQEMFDWWLTRERYKDDKHQCPMFN